MRPAVERVVVEDDRCSTVDEDRLWADAQRCGEAITARSALSDEAEFAVC